MTQAGMTQEDLNTAHGQQIGTLGRMLAIVVGHLHDAGALDGRAVTASIRLDSAAGDEELRLAAADLMERIIDDVEGGRRAGLRPVADT